MIRFIIAITALMAYAVAMAVPAFPGPIVFTQPDGSEITVYIRGDERAHCYLSADGYLLVNDNNALYYGKALADGKIVRSDILAKKAENRSASDLAFLAGVDMSLVDSSMRKIAEQSKFSVGEMAMRPAAKAASSSASEQGHPSYGKGLFPGTHFPAFGEQKGLVVLVEYQDVKFTLANAADYFSRLLNEEGFSDYNATGSARDYFIQNSNGQFMPEFDVYGPITLSHNREFYGGNNKNGDDNAPEQMVIEACQQLDSEVDFTQYDRDGDGLIDNVYVFYAGSGEASGGGANSVWPHSWNVVYVGNYMFDGVRLANYACSNEWYSGPDGIGTFVHEFSHVMGLPDLYATSYTSSFTPGSWCVMDNGSYNNNSRTPPGYGAFERNALGWCKPKVVTGEEGDCELEHIGETNEAYLIPTEKANEFFLMENRQKKGWDTYIPGHGMLIWHIDYNEAVWNSNTVNNTSSHQRVDLEEADGMRSEENRDGDAFPGTAGVTSFTDDTNPGMLTWSDSRLYMPITDIKESNGVVSFHIETRDKPEPLAMEEPTPDDISSTSVTLRWGEVQGTRYYKLYFEALDDSYSGIFKNGRNVGKVNTMTVDGLKPDTEYMAYVVPVSISNKVVFGAPSNTIYVRTLDESAAIGSIEADDLLAPVEFFNLQGVKVDAEHLAPGVYIRRQGATAKKIVIR